jgi:hypothetical protein
MADQDKRNVNPNTHAGVDVSPETEAMDVSIGGKKQKVETEGITIRGCGAATKGTKARGPMA